MENTNGQQPAYPHEDIEYDGGNQYKVTHNGLTKREYFAAMAMQGLISKERYVDGEDLVKFPRMAVDFADALLTQLNKEV